MSDISEELNLDQSVIEISADLYLRIRLDMSTKEATDRSMKAINMWADARMNHTATPQKVFGQSFYVVEISQSAGSGPWIDLEIQMKA